MEVSQVVKGVDPAKEAFLSDLFEDSNCVGVFSVGIKTLRSLKRVKI